MSTDYAYSVRLDTDEGIDDTDAIRLAGEGQAMGHALHQAYGRFLPQPPNTNGSGRTCAARTATSTT